MQELLNDIPHSRLRVYLVWLPILREDAKQAAAKHSQSYSDPRLTYFWDPSRFCGKTWQQVLDLDQIAWDLYFIYDAGVQWPDEPTVPEFWMRQLKGVMKAPFLDITVFKSKVREMLSKGEELSEG